MKILILYEHKNREMESIVLIKYELMRRGHRVRLENIHELLKIKRLFDKPDVIVCPFLYGDHELENNIIERYGKVSRIVNLQWEQVYADKSTYYKRIPSGKARDAVHICWGERQYQLLKSNGCSNAVLAGPVHLDFLKPDFQGWYISREELLTKYGIDKTKKTLLFISSFTMFYKTDEEVEGLKRFFDFDVFEFRSLSIKSRDTILDWFERLLEDNKEINIIYRPHPGELADERLKRLCKDHDNMFCISEQSVKQWIMACDVTLNWLSTSSVEACYCGKPTLFLRPYELEERMDYEMFCDACKASDYDDFVGLISNTDQIDKYYELHPMKSRLSEYYLNNASFSYNRVCDAIEKASFFPQSSFENRGRFNHVKVTIKESILSRLYPQAEKGNPLARRIISSKASREKRLKERLRLLRSEYISPAEEKELLVRIHSLLKG